MDPKFVLSHVDHTLLKPEATFADISRLCEEALFWHTASVCINPRYVEYAVTLLGGKLPVCTVIGFPLGAMTAPAKVFEAQDAVSRGAGEIDMVISVGDLIEGRMSAVQEEIAAVKQAIGERILKIIIETCLLTESQKNEMCRIVADAGADYIKTSNGFSSGGATFDDVALMVKHGAGRIKVKAAGGIRSFGDMERFLELGADRLGCSSAVRLASA